MLEALCIRKLQGGGGGGKEERKRMIFKVRGARRCAGAVSWGISLNQRSPALLAPGVGFAEDGFFTAAAGGGGVGGDGPGGNASHGEPQVKLPSRTTTHLPLCGPVPDRPRTGTGGWGPLA